MSNNAVVQLTRFIENAQVDGNKARTLMNEILNYLCVEDINRAEDKEQVLYNHGTAVVLIEILNDYINNLNRSMDEAFKVAQDALCIIRNKGDNENDN